MVGTRGVPARYGGFETAVEEVGRRLVARGHEVRVYTRRAADGPKVDRYLGMEVVTLPALRRRSLETLSHTGLSVLHLLRDRCDLAFVFNAANAPWLPLVRVGRIPVATHVDGLEWRRGKWGAAGRRYYRLAEREAVRWSDALIADAQGIADYYAEEFGAATDLIAYGAPLLSDVGTSRLADIGLEPGEYHLVVARFEPENHVEMIVRAYVASGAHCPLVVVGSAPYSNEYTRKVHHAAAGDPRVRFEGGVWDQELLDEMYAHALTYVHGHSVGGTNPSLLRAIGAGTATIAYNVGFNREVLLGAGRYFDSAQDLARALEESEDDRDDTSQRAEQLRRRAHDYEWDDVAERYGRLAARLAERNSPGPQWRVRRRRSAARGKRFRVRDERRRIPGAPGSGD